MHTYSFEKLEVGVEAKKLSKDIYTITSKFSPDEKFGLTSQLRRAFSICSNIAEASAIFEQIESITNKLNALRNYQINE